MRTKAILSIIMLALTACMNGAMPMQAPSPQPATYIEPSLRSTEAEMVSIIVTANDSQVAAEAVERLGGQVSSDLWLIDAVVASLPPTNYQH